MLADPTAVAKGIPWELDLVEEGLLEDAVDTLSEEARFYGLASWTDETKTPRYVCKLVSRAASRFMRNPEGYVQSRAGDETVAWNVQDDRAGSPYFTDDEKKRLASFRGNRTLYSTQVVAYGRGDRNITPPVPVSDGSKPFPLFAHRGDPW